MAAPLDGPMETGLAETGSPIVGILGGGQLARMLALAGVPLGMRVHALDPATDACAGSVCQLHVAAYDDLDAVQRMARQIHRGTFDFENVPAAGARALAEHCPLFPSVAALEACQDRLAEKNLLRELGVAVGPFHPVESRVDLLEARTSLGLPLVLKTRRLGYDGKGQVVLRQDEDLERAWQKLGGQSLIAEAFVPFDAECSLIAARSSSGSITFWPLTFNLHREGILALSMPDPEARTLQAQGEQAVGRILEHFDYVGVITVEFFIQQGTLLANEIAPRVHNSGHWTIDGAITSQFENHMRAICDWPLGATTPFGASLMFNWVGELPLAAELLQEPGLHWHDYGKAPRPGRKLGHATLVRDSLPELWQAAGRLVDRLGGDWPPLLHQFRHARAQALHLPEC